MMDKAAAEKGSIEWKEVYISGGIERKERITEEERNIKRKIHRCQKALIRRKTYRAVKEDKLIRFKNQLG